MRFANKEEKARILKSERNIQDSPELYSRIENFTFYSTIRNCKFYEISIEYNRTNM